MYGKTLLMTSALMALAACSESGPAVDQAQLDRGEKISQSCVACHTLTGTFAQVGPGLKDVVGRKSGSLPDYDYSPAMKNSHLVWTKENLAKYLQGPEAVVPGTKMTLSPLSQKEAEDVVAYLGSLSS